MLETPEKDRLMICRVDDCKVTLRRICKACYAIDWDSADGHVTTRRFHAATDNAALEWFGSYMARETKPT